MKQVGILTFGLILFFSGRAQQFGGFPPSTQWKQINTDTARILFIAGAEKQAFWVASLIHRLAADTPQSLGPRLRKINTVLHSRTTLANGYVALGPWRSEYYLIPSSNLFEMGNLPWHEQLAIHEFRHVHQYNNFNRGLAKAFFFLFGEQGRALANGMAIPDWFFEGDAVHAETALSPSGRGRLGLFHSGYHSLWQAGKNYSWQKLRNGSLKDYVPNHYQLGYLLTNYGYLQYGDAFWKKVTRDASGFKGLFYPWQSAIRRHTGVDYKTFRNNALAFYRQQLDSNVKDLPQGNYKTVTDHYFPQQIGEDSLLYVKRAYNQVPAFYLYTAGREEKIRNRSISYEDWFSYRNGKIVYTAYSTHPRWSYVDYSDVVVLDLETGKEERLSSKERFFTPDIAPSGKKIIVVKMTHSLESQLVMLDAATKQEQLIKAGGEIMFVHPRYIDENRIVCGLRLPDAKLSLEILDLQTGKWEMLVPPGFHTMGHPFVQGDTIYFAAGFKGNDDLYAVDINSKNIYQLSTGYTGSYYPSVNGESMYYSRFTVKGLEWRRENLGDLLWKRIQPSVEQSSIHPVAFEQDYLQKIQRERSSVKRYNKGTALFNFHSWAPGYTSPEYSFSLYSDNILNTFSSQLYYRYNENENSHAVGFNSSYGGFFTQLNAGAEYIFKRMVFTQAGPAFYDQYELRFGYNIPLHLTRGRSYRFLDLGSNIVYMAAEPQKEYRHLIRGSSGSFLHHFLTASQYRPMALQHIYPKLGYTAGMHYRHGISRKEYQALANVNLFLPSVGNHSIVLQGSVQQTDSSSVLLANRFSFSRGYNERYLPLMYRFGVNYHLPLFYPDFGIASIVYFQRVRGNIFYDWTRAEFESRGFERDYRSWGGEIYFDTRWWNQQPLSFGVRVSNLLDPGLAGEERGDVRWELVFSF